MPACSCERFRPRAEYNQTIFYSKTLRRRDEQRCRECVCLEGQEYEPGSRLEEYLVPFVWCLKCKMVAKAPVDTGITLCSSCYKETNKLAREQKKIRRSRTIEEATSVTFIQERKSGVIEEARRKKLAQERNSRRIRRSRAGDRSRYRLSEDLNGSMTVATCPVSIGLMQARRTMYKSRNIWWKGPTGHSRHTKQQEHMNAEIRCPFQLLCVFYIKLASCSLH